MLNFRIENPQFELDSLFLSFLYVGLQLSILLNIANLKDFRHENLQNMARFSAFNPSLLLRIKFLWTWKSLTFCLVA